MSKQIFLLRYSLIIKRLEKGPATFEQIDDYLRKESEIKGLDYTISLRTFQREIKDIFSKFNIEIINEKKGDKRYFIKSQPELPEYSQRLLDSYQMINAIESSSDNLKYIFFETRKAKGLEYFAPLLQAIKTKKIVEFTHYKYWEDVLKKRSVNPLALKEAKGRWYLIAIDSKDNILKTFGLDRVDDLSVTKISFKTKHVYDFDKLFNNSFGIINDENEKPHSIVLSFSFEQGQYVKNYPLHHSQKILEEGDRISISLFLSPTYDFIMELLSYGEEIKVISPIFLQKAIEKIYKKTLEQYQSKS